MLEERTSLGNDQASVSNPDIHADKGTVVLTNDGEIPGALEQVEEEEPSLLVGPGSLENFDIPIVFNEAVQYFVQFFTVEKRKVFTRWLKRSERYVPMIRDILRVALTRRPIPR